MPRPSTEDYEVLRAQLRGQFVLEGILTQSQGRGRAGIGSLQTQSISQPVMSGRDGRILQFIWRDSASLIFYQIIPRLMLEGRS